jgi:anti-anti-sigma factor
MDAEEQDVVCKDYKNHKLVEFKNIKNLDLYSVRYLSDIFTEENKTGVLDWIIDLSTIEFIDSSGLGALAKQSTTLFKHSKKIKIMNPKQTVLHTLKVSGFAKIFDFIQSLDEI